MVMSKVFKEKRRQLSCQHRSPNLEPCNNNLFPLSLLNREIDLDVIFYIRGFQMTFPKKYMH